MAEAAGVSTATVSRALAFPDRLRPETRERVLAAVRRLGYTPNEAARALRAGASRMILVVVPYLYSGAFFAGIINSIDAELSAEGYTMIVGSLDGIEDKARRLVDLVYARQIDGVIVLTGHIPLIDGRSLRDAGVPIVSICCEMDMPDLPTVLVNDEECAIAQTRHLIDLGHRHLLYVSGPEDHYNEIVRYRGYLRAATASNVKTLRYARRLHPRERRRCSALFSEPRPPADGRRVLQRRNGDRLHQDGDRRGRRRSRRGFRRRFRRH